MIAYFVAQLGPWSWWIVGLVFLGLEILVPGVFLLWIGLAAIVIGAVSFAFWESAIWVWQLQLITFAVLAVMLAFWGRRITGSNIPSDQPMLNRRVEGLVGRTATLEEPISDNKGRIRLDDTFWIVEGPNLPAGTKVRVTTAKTGCLCVERLETL